MPLTKCDIVV